MMPRVADAGGHAPLVRTGGYTTVLALVLVKAAVERGADAPPNSFEGSVCVWGSLGYVTGNSTFAAGYLIVLLPSPLVACGFDAWAGRS